MINRRGGFIQNPSTATKSPNKNPPTPPANNRPLHRGLIEVAVAKNNSGIVDIDRLLFNGIDARWLTGGVGGFLFVTF